MIQASAERSRTVRADKESVLALLLDVSTSGPFFPGVDGIEDPGDGQFRWTLATRRTLGSSFTGRYIAKYERTGDEVHWSTVEGNMKVKGRWKVSGPEGMLKLSVAVTSELDAPVPKILKRPAVLFAEMESKSGLDKQLEKIDLHLSRAG